MRHFSKLVITLQVAYIASTSVQFQSKERGNMSRAKNGYGSIFREANTVPCQTWRKHLLCGLLSKQLSISSFSKMKSEKTYTT